MVLLEGGAVLATPQQISLHADLEVTSQQLRKALETVEEQSKELDIKKDIQDKDCLVFVFVFVFVLKWFSLDMVLS